MARWPRRHRGVTGRGQAGQQVGKAGAECDQQPGPALLHGGDDQLGGPLRREAEPAREFAAVLCLVRGGSSGDPGGLGYPGADAAGVRAVTPTAAGQFGPRDPR